MKGKSDISPQEWNFDAVPDKELVACCYWEFARESAFIRGLRQRSWDHWRPLYLKDQWWNKPEDPQLHEDLRKVQTIGYPAEVFLRGMACPPDGVLPDAPPLKPGEVHPATGSFPKPWLALTREERAYRARIRNDRMAVPLVPFGRAFSFEAKDIAEWVASRRQQLERERQEVREKYPQLNEERLREQGKWPIQEIRPSLRWESGTEVTVVRVAWAHFTNEELVKGFAEWVKANRPKDAKAPDLRGHKARDRRANLTRLAAMRLLARFTVRELVAEDACPAVWQTKQFGGKKWADPTKWRDARREAGALFHRLFPFLPKEEKPRSWERTPAPDRKVG